MDRPQSANPQTAVPRLRMKVVGGQEDPKPSRPLERPEPVEFEHHHEVVHHEGLGEDLVLTREGHLHLRDQHVVVQDVLQFHDHQLHHWLRKHTTMHHHHLLHQLCV